MAETNSNTLAVRKLSKPQRIQRNMLIDSVIQKHLKTDGEALLKLVNDELKSRRLPHVGLTGVYSRRAELKRNKTNSKAVAAVGTMVKESSPQPQPVQPVYVAQSTPIALSKKMLSAVIAGGVSSFSIRINTLLANGEQNYVVIHLVE